MSVTPMPTNQALFETSPTRLKVVTFNTWKCDGPYALRLQAMSQQMQALEADVWVLQECFSTTDGGTDTARFLARMLGMHLHIAPARQKRRQFQGEWADSFSSLAVLSRWPIASGQALALPSSLADGGREAQLCSIAFEGRTLLLANVHLTHLLDQEGSLLRSAQLQTVLSQLAQMPPHDLALVCGDFNASMEAQELADLMKLPWGLLDVFAQHGSAEKITCHSPDGASLNLDHILYVPTCSRVALQCVNAEVVLHAALPPWGVMPSDHAGVSVTLQVG